MGTLAKNLFRFSGVSGTPANVSNRPVPDSSGLMLLTRMLCGAYSAARPFVACVGGGGKCGALLGRGGGDEGEAEGKGKGNGERTLATAAFDALYHTNPGRGRDAPTEAMLMIEPPPWASMRGTTACVPRKTDLTFRRMTRSKSASLTEPVGFS